MNKDVDQIAIVGMGCRFPGKINSAEQLWSFLKRKGNGITDVPADRWSIDSFYDPDPLKAGKIKSRKGGFLKNIDHFDPKFFNIFPTEAIRMDPQQRFLLEVTHEALEDAGIRLEDVSGSKTSTHIGVFMNDYWDIQSSNLERNNITPHLAMGVCLTSISNRIAYQFNLKGPSMTLDTACSSSMVAIHLACEGLRKGDTDLAIAGGANLIIRPESSIMMSKGGFLSPDGYCKSFDASANGYVRSEGVENSSWFTEANGVQSILFKD
jgi:polyketide synthase 12